MHEKRFHLKKDTHLFTNAHYATKSNIYELQLHENSLCINHPVIFLFLLSDIIKIYFYYFHRFSEFEVPSLNFPGQVHVWKLSQFLQKGSEPSRETLLGDLALAAQFIVITSRARIIGHFFSVKEAAKALLSGMLKLVDMIVGIPSLLAHNLENKVKEERCRYLVAELVCRVRIL